MFRENFLDSVIFFVIFLIIIIKSKFRRDGRLPNELRLISCEMGVLPSFDGSAVFCLGLTKVLATVSGPKQVSFI
jgi:exosome complex component RRP41